MNAIFVYVTNPTKESAKSIAWHLLEKKLIACVNIYPVTSMYWWQNKIEDEDEWVLIAKTLDDKYAEVKTEIESIHSYDTPCITKIPVDANEKYFNWLKNEVTA